MLVFLSVGIKFLRSLILRSGFPKIILSINSNFFFRNSQINVGQLIAHRKVRYAFCIGRE